MEEVQMKTMSRATALLLVLALPAIAQHAPAGPEQQAAGNMTMHTHMAGAPVSYAELKNTVAQLERARQATAKYQDVHVAEADGYRAMGPDFPGAGVHFVLTMETTAFDVEKPPILLYEKDPAAPSGYSLVGVTYLLNAPAGPDGQPLNSPFPKSLASWHRHGNLCLFPDVTNPHGFTESQCREKGGQFIAETQWMLHAWIWRDSPLGVFSPENPSVK
jgi:hypothetical protein